MSTAPATPALSDAEYHREAEALLSRVEATTDRWLDEDVVDILSLIHISEPTRPY